MQKSINVRILDRDYPLLVQAEDEVMMRNLASLVDERMRTFKTIHPNQPDLVAAVVTALGIAEELVATRETSNVVLSALDREVALLDRELANALKP